MECEERKVRSRTKAKDGRDTGWRWPKLRFEPTVKALVVGRTVDGSSRPYRGRANDPAPNWNHPPHSPRHTNTTDVKWPSCLFLQLPRTALHYLQQLLGDLQLAQLLTSLRPPTREMGEDRGGLDAKGAVVDVEEPCEDGR